MVGAGPAGGSVTGGNGFASRVVDRRKVPGPDPFGGAAFPGGAVETAAPIEPVRPTVTPGTWKVFDGPIGAASRGGAAPDKDATSVRMPNEKPKSTSRR